MVSGCAAERMQLADFDAAVRADVEVTDPVEYSELCDIPWDTVECYQRLEAFENEAVDNKELAQLNADIARDGDKAYDAILSAAKRQQEIAQIRQEMFEAEVRDHFKDNIQYGAVILLLALGLML